jgi:DNA-binding transcriptional LysR family regulator
VAVLPLDEVPKRFAVRVLYEEDFVVAARADHPFLKSPGLKRFLEARHLLVSETGEAAGIVDAALEKCGLSRRIGVTVPNFAFALVLLAENRPSLRTAAHVSRSERRSPWRRGSRGAWSCHGTGSAPLRPRVPRRTRGLLGSLKR